MPNSLLYKVSPAAARFVEELGMEITTEVYDEKCFGNIWIIARSPGFDLQACRDRGDVIFDISPPRKNDWHLLRAVLVFLGVDCRDASSEKVIEALAQRLDDITKLMACDLKEAGFIEFKLEVSRHKWSSSFLEQHFGRMKDSG